MLSARLRKATERLAERSDAIVSRVLDAGLANLAWPLAVGACLGSLGVAAAPAFGSALNKKYGDGALVVLAALLTFACAALGTWRARARGSAHPWHEVGRWFRRFASPLLLGPIVLALSKGLEKRHSVLVLGLAVAGAWVVAVCVRSWLGSVPETETTPSEDAAEASAPETKRARWPWWALGGLCAAYSAGFSWLALNNHWAFNTGRADLGFYVSIFRRSSMGDFLGCTICGGGNHLSGHFDPILVLLSPIYLIHPDAETVLVLQSLLLGSTMVPLYLLARHHGLTASVALLLCTCFGLHPALHGINLFDFHSLALLVPAATWLLWARDTGRRKAYWLLFALLLLVREDAALVAVFIGADTLLMRRRGSALTGLATIGLALLYFVSVKALLMGNPDPLSPGGGRGYAYYYQDLVPKGTGTMGLASTVLSQPDKVLRLIAQEDKVVYWMQLLVPLLGLPLLAHRGRLLLGYGAAFTLLASREFVYSLHFHYSSVVIPFLFYLGAIALSKPQRNTRWLRPLIGRTALGRRRLQLLVIAAALGATTLVSWRFGAILPNKTFHAGFRPLKRFPTERHLENERSLEQICRAVPKDAIVAANEPDLPHMGRCGGYQMKKRRLKADYLAWSVVKSSAAEEIRREVAAGYWEVVGKYGRYTLYKNVAPKDATIGAKKARIKPKRSAPRSKRKARPVKKGGGKNRD